MWKHSCLLSHLSLEVSSMTDEERDQIDTDAETYMRTCSVAIQSLKTEGMDKIILPFMNDNVM